MQTKSSLFPYLFMGISLCGLTGCGDEPLISKDIAKEQVTPKQKIENSDNSIEYEKKVFVMVNQYRNRHGLPPLELDTEISEIARNHSINMAKGLSQWGHEGYNDRTKMVSTIIHWEEFGENLAKVNTENPPLQAILAWINSPLHEDNLSGEFTLTGIGVARSVNGEYFFTQIFIRT